MEISIELVPRSIEQLTSELNLLKEFRTEITRVNIPDLPRLQFRSYEVTETVAGFSYPVIPHIRACDFDLSGPLPFDKVLPAGSDGILIVKGDPPKDDSYKCYDTTSIELCGAIKKSNPSADLYGVIDPYRGIEAEYLYIEEKISAGFDGFFTNPFFDLELMRDFIQPLLGRGLKIYVGICPVVSERSKAYWERTNNVIFPEDFEPTLEWNVVLAKKIMAFCEENGLDLYLMPIKIDLEKYLNGLFL